MQFWGDMLKLLKFVVAVVMRFGSCDLCHHVKKRLVQEKYPLKKNLHHQFVKIITLINLGDE
jgi:hypothetical protein